MKTALMMFAAAAALAACAQDETVAAYGAADRVWQLESLDGVPVEQRVTLQFGSAGRIFGEAPCNSYFGQQTAPYPWFALEGVGSTRRSCPDLSIETGYLTALRAMTLSEVSGPVLRLNNDAGREMIFRASLSDAP